MSNLPSNNSPEPLFEPKRSLGLDEWIAIILTLATFGPSFFWVILKQEFNTSAVAGSNDSKPEALKTERADSEIVDDNLSFVALSNDSSHVAEGKKCEFSPAKSVSNTAPVGQLIPVSTETLAATPAVQVATEQAPKAEVVTPVASTPTFREVTPEARTLQVVDPSDPPPTLQATTPEILAVDPSDPPPKLDNVAATSAEEEEEVQTISLAEVMKDWQKMELPISLNSRKGEKLLMNSASRMDYLPLTMEFVSEDSSGYSGVASAVMALNALHVPAPTASGFEQEYKFFTQKNAFDNEMALKVASPEKISSEGMTLKQLTKFVQSHGIAAEAKYSDEMSLDEFRSKVIENLEQGHNFILVNYSRETIAQEKGAHISPIAAYNKKSDRFLILDVARYKSAPIWVTAEQLWEATKAEDPASGKSMGFVWVGK